jgi:hypothetical protein
MQPNVETTTEEAPSIESAPSPSALSADELAAVRDLVLRAYPETVPELIGGDSVATLLRSLEPAAAAYQRIAQGVAARVSPPAAPAAPTVPTVPAGSAPPLTIDPDQLPSVEKIRRALSTRR